MHDALIAFLAAVLTLGGGGVALARTPLGTANEEGGRYLAVVDTLEPYEEQISETLSTFEMRPVPVGTITIETGEGERTVEVGPFWIARTEVRWAPYKVFMYGRDQQDAGDGVDAVSRPTNALSYIAAHFGGPKEGHPARAMTRKAARNYARWLTQKTGHEYRLPTAAEWIHACRSGMSGRMEALGKYAWHKGNSEGETHPVGSKAADARGVHDLLGNLSEWTYTPSRENRRVLRGGSYQTGRSKVRCSARIEEKTQAWKRTDPQLPRSKWWFSDAPFVGFRVVRVPGDG
jgi:formylglycine-generating enzyme required for sulfatase activity